MTEKIHKNEKFVFIFLVKNVPCLKYLSALCERMHYLIRHACSIPIFYCWLSNLFHFSLVKSKVCSLMRKMAV